MGRRRYRKGPRHQYSPDVVAYRVLSDEKLYRVCEIVFTSSDLIHATDVSKKLGISVGYAYLLLKKLEKWRVVVGVRDPVNGKLAFKVGIGKVAELVGEEIKKRRAKELENVIIRPQL